MNHTIDLTPIPIPPDEMVTPNEPAFQPKVMLMEVMRVKADGMDLVEMEKRIALIGKLKHANGTLEVDGGEWSILKQSYLAFPWRIASQAVLELRDRIVKAPTAS